MCEALWHILTYKIVFYGFKKQKNCHGNCTAQFDLCGKAGPISYAVSARMTHISIRATLLRLGPESQKHYIVKQTYNFCTCACVKHFGIY